MVQVRKQTRRQFWEWLALVLYIECTVLLMFQIWRKESLLLIGATSLTNASPAPEWWVMMINMFLLSIGLGITVWWFKRYGVLAGLTIFVLGVLLLESL